MKSQSSAFRATVVLVITGAILSGCVTTAQRSINKFERGSQDLSILLMPMDIELSELTAGGVREPKADWTAKAEKNVRVGIDRIFERNKAKLITYTQAEPDTDAYKSEVQLVKLHGAVGATILQSQLLLPLPTKQGKFEWTLGITVQRLRKNADADYGLFVFMRDSYASAGRAAVMAIGIILGVSIPGGQQVGYASLVDLKTGEVVWFNRLARGAGDLRTEKEAMESVELMFAELPK